VRDKYSSIIELREDLHFNLKNNSNFIEYFKNRMKQSFTEPQEYSDLQIEKIL
jgi:hypothetical protein